MSKKPSAETLLRSAKRMLNEAEAERDAAQSECRKYRERATKAEQEVAEWKKRFDALLTRTPPGNGDAPGGEGSQ